MYLLLFECDVRSGTKIEIPNRVVFRCFQFSRSCMKAQKEHFLFESMQIILKILLLFRAETVPVYFLVTSCNEKLK